MTGLRRRPQADFDEEIRSHIAMEEERLRAEGYSERDARDLARRRFGNVGTVQERYNDMLRPAWVTALGQDLRYAVRQIRHSPLFATVVVLTLALGIGANAIIFGLVDRLMLSPPARVGAADELVRIHFRERRSSPQEELATTPVTSFPMITALQQQVPSLEGVAGVGFASEYTLGSGPEAIDVQALLVTGNFFDVLQVRPAAGRFFGPDEDQLPAGSPVAVASYGFWQNQLGADRGAIGREIRLGKSVLTIIGVAPRGFTGIDMRKVDLFIPVSTLAAAGMGDDWATTPNSIWIRAVGRLAPGATTDRVNAEATTVFRRQLAEWKQPGRDSLGTVIAGSIIAARGPEERPREARVSLWLVGVSAIVLIVACANVANLLLARAIRRRREIAVRLSLGAGRGRLVRQLLTETVLLAVISAAAAVLVIHVGGQAVRTLLLPNMAWDGSPVDGRVLAFTGLVTLLTVVLAGVVPALQASSANLTEALKAGARDGGMRSSRLRNGLLVAQAALSVVLLVGAGLFVQSLQRVRNLDVGVDLPRVLLVRAGLVGAGFDESARRDILNRALERARALPGVERAALIGGSVPTRSANAFGFREPGRDSLPELSGGGPYYTAAGADYFSALGARITRGRGLTEQDERTGARVVVVNDMIARNYWPDGSAIGKCVLMGRDSTCSEVVGVVQDVVLFQMIGDERAQVYLPLTHPAVAARTPSAMIVRTRPGSAGAAAGSMIRREMQALAPNMPHVDVRSFEDLLAPQLQPWRLGATLFAVFGSLALVISAIGLYSVLAYAVSQRLHEIGTRMALGATHNDVVRLIVRGGVGLALLGTMLGVLLALLSAPRIESLLHQTSPRDPMTFIVVATTLIIVAFAASAIPAWRASRVDPSLALREE